MANYKKRILDDYIARRLKSKGAVLIEGPKWCGKTTSCEQHANSTLYLSQPDQLSHNLQLAELNPSLLLQGDSPRLIDEWQLAPKLWDAVRFEVDHRDGMGHFLLTGSSVAADFSQVQHTGTGRFAWIKMRPMTLFESGDSSGDISLAQLFTPSSDPLVAQTQKTLEDIAFALCRGGWPQTLSLEGDDALSQSFDYLDAVCKSDISRLDGIKRSEERARQLLRSLARHQGTQAPNTVICDDVNQWQTLFSIDTLSSYLEALKKIFVVENSPAWNPNLRSKTAIRSSDTHYFIDPSIASAALGVGPRDLMGDLKTFGFLFETLCIRDLRVYTEALGGQVYHFRNKEGLECDAVLHLRNGDYGLVEIKLGGDQAIEEGVKSLQKLRAQVNLDQMKAPSFLMVLTAVGSYAYQRADGIYVVPIATLGP